jgi:hypothetical protein
LFDTRKDINDHHAINRDQGGWQWGSILNLMIRC